MPEIIIIDLGIADYSSVLKHQKELFEQNLNNKISGTPTQNYLILCEHPHVYTLGKSGDNSNMLISDELLKKIGATFHKTDRGGDITYHGPGQLVAYPIFDLDSFKIGVRDFILKIENSVIEVLKEHGISSGITDEFIGVWIDLGQKTERKICALGVKVSRAVSMHGFALNVNTDLDYFKYINPCGFTEKGVTSIEQELGVKINFELIKQEVIQAIFKQFLFTT